MIFKSLLRIFSVLFFCRVLSAVPADVEDLSDRAYFPALLKEIQTAQKSIYACLYYISYSQKKEGKVHQLLNALIDAEKRGVDVQILLDQSFEKAGGDDTNGKNLQAFSYLKQNGIPVFYDDMKTMTHAKYWIMDQKLLILGSFNLSDKSLNENRECAALIRSPELAGQYLKRFQTIPKTTPEPVKDAIPIPREFIRDTEQASRMASNHSNHLLDFYLLLLKESFEQKSATVILTEQQIYSHLYEGTKTKFRTLLILTYFMEHFIGPIKSKFQFLNCDYDREKKTVTFHLEKENTLQPQSLYLSQLYWEDLWDKRLSEKALFSLLYVLDKTDSGRMGRYFEEGRWDAVKKYKVDHTVFAYGLQELQRWNLIEKYIHFEKDQKNVNGYQLNDFYRLADFEKSLSAIREKADPETFQWTMDIADLVDEPHDLEAIRKIAELGKEYGAENLKSVADQIRKKGGLSRYRRLNYVLAVIRNQKTGKPVTEEPEEVPNED